MDEPYFIGECSNCGTEDVPVHRGIHGHAKFNITGDVEDRTSDWCMICRRLIRPEEPENSNLAYCTHLLLKALDARVQ